MFLMRLHMICGALVGAHCGAPVSLLLVVRTDILPGGMFRLCGGRDSDLSLLSPAIVGVMSLGTGGMSVCG